MAAMCNNGYLGNGSMAGSMANESQLANISMAESCGENISLNVMANG
jgi:hypothetical protein